MLKHLQTLEFSFLGGPEHGVNLISRELLNSCMKFLHQENTTMQKGTVPVNRLSYHARPTLVKLYSQTMPHCLNLSLFPKESTQNMAHNLL